MENLGQMERSALLLYVQNVRDLEIARNCIQRKYNNDANTYNSNIRCLDTTQTIYEHWKKPKGPDFRFLIIAIALILITFGITKVTYEKYEYYKYESLGASVEAYQQYIRTGIYYKPAEYESLEFTALWKFIFALLLAGISLIFGIVRLSGLIGELQDYTKELHEWRYHEKNLSSYNETERRRAEEHKQKKQEWDNWWTGKSNFYNAELGKINEILNSFYSMNVIPVQYRNLASICYIYDYLSTSVESLSAALFSNQIEEGIRRLEAKLEVIVSSIEEAIYETRCLREENRERYQRDLKQNNKILNELSEINDNSQKAAYYAELDSNYNKACAYFSLATYLKN